MQSMAYVRLKVDYDLCKNRNHYNMKGGAENEN